VLVAVSPLLAGIGGRYFEDCNEASTVSQRRRTLAEASLLMLWILIMLHVSGDCTNSHFLGMNARLTLGVRSTYWFVFRERQMLKISEIVERASGLYAKRPNR